MKSKDIEVGKTYLYARDRYSPKRIVRVLQVLTQVERAEVIKEQLAREGRSIRPFARDEMSDAFTIQVESLVKFGERGKVEPLTETLWVRPATILQEDTVEAAEQRYAERQDALAVSEREARATVKRITEALDGTGLPLPEVEAPSAWSRRPSDRYTVRYPRWGAKDYERLVELLERQET